MQRPGRDVRLGRTLVDGAPMSRTFAPQVKKGLTRALGAGMRLLPAQFLSGERATVVNGWRYPPPAEGRAGDDFLLRAASYPARPDTN